MYSIVATVELYSDVNPEGKSNQRNRNCINYLTKKKEEMRTGKALLEYDSCCCRNADTQMWNQNISIVEICMG